MNPVKLAAESIKSYLLRGKILNLPKNLPDDLLKPAGAFVSLHTKDGELRGCIGTIFPTENTLAEEIIGNAVSAATRDNRFPPLTQAELEDLIISVDILSKPVSIKKISELDPKKYGLIVKDRAGRSGVLLPDIPGIETVADQLEICLQKAGISEPKDIELYKFTTKRYF